MGVGERSGRGGGIKVSTAPPKIKMGTAVAPATTVSGELWLFWLHHHVLPPRSKKVLAVHSSQSVLQQMGKYILVYVVI